MVEVQRIWRITTSSGNTVQVRLSPDRQGAQQLVLEGVDSESTNGQTFDVEVARALAQAMLEACEVALALE